VLDPNADFDALDPDAYFFDPDTDTTFYTSGPGEAAKDVGQILSKRLARMAELMSELARLKNSARTTAELARVAAETQKAIAEFDKMARETQTVLPALSSARGTAGRLAMDRLGLATEQELANAISLRDRLAAAQDALAVAQKRTFRDPNMETQLQNRIAQLQNQLTTLWRRNPHFDDYLARVRKTQDLLNRANDIIARRNLLGFPQAFVGPLF
jgi:hypothetical protein